ncbi:MAG: hypothetical protein KIS66_02505 [Fimbriimonadaceae bacterium]|nr:hypothetical protein [Fimbriimonadaceae bacterium]
MRASRIEAEARTATVVRHGRRYELRRVGDTVQVREEGYRSFVTFRDRGVARRLWESASEEAGGPSW